MMTRKHYVLIARELAFMRGQGYDERTLDEVAKRLSIVMKQDNSNHNRSKFLTAAGIELSRQ